MLVPKSSTSPSSGNPTRSCKIKRGNLDGKEKISQECSFSPLICDRSKRARDAACTPGVSLSSSVPRRLGAHVVYGPKRLYYSFRLTVYLISYFAAYNTLRSSTPR